MEHFLRNSTYAKKSNYRCYAFRLFCYTSSTTEYLEDVDGAREDNYSNKDAFLNG